MMMDSEKTNAQLIDELAELRSRISIYEPQQAMNGDCGKTGGKSQEAAGATEIDYSFTEENYEIINFLKDSRLFSHLPQHYLEQLIPLSEIMSLPAGAEVIREGEENNRVFFLIRGQIEIYAGNQLIISLKRQGDIFGEMSIISDKPATASVRTKGPVKLFSITGRDIGKYTEIDSDAFNNILYRIFAMVMTDKLTMTTLKAKKFEFSEKKLLQEVKDRKKTEKTLRESEIRLNSAQTVAKIGSWEYDIETAVLWGSRQAARTFGINTDVPHLPLETIEPLIPDFPRIKQALNDLIHQNIAFDIEFEIHLDNSSAVTVRTIAELVWEDDIKKKVIGIVQDITEQKKTGQERRQLENQLFQAQKLDALGILASGIAHDFNNLLSVFYNYSELSIKKLNDSPEAEKIIGYQNNIRKAAGRAENLINQILTFSRSGGFNPENIDLTPFIEESIKFLRSSIPSTILISNQIEQNLKNVFGDPIQIQQVIMNLCTNASHAMESKGGELEITVSNIKIDVVSTETGDCQPGNYVLLSVSDTGEGIDQKKMERMYEPFFTTKKAGKGTGLGLSVVHGIVKKHDGTILCHSKLRHGTTFQVYFPVSENDPQEIVKERDDALPRGSETILIVDDEKLIRNSYAEMLELQGYTVKQASSGVYALEEIQNNIDLYDLVITDYTMPKMTGVELCKEIKKINSTISTVLVSGLGQQMNNSNPEACCVSVQLKKPVGFDYFVRTVRDVLDN
jgi:signal transduction histidine kinase/CheY-like chemotaxis protein/CRP-like cAMP-binding protein